MALVPLRQYVLPRLFETTVLLGLREKELALDPAHPKALEMAGSAAFEAGEFAAAARYWRDLLARMPPGNGAYRELGSAVARAEAQAIVPGAR